MTETELRELIQERYPRENAQCEWKGYAKLKHAVSGIAEMTSHPIHRL